MKTVIIYESVHGNTRRVADELAAVASGYGEVTTAAAEDAGADIVVGADLVLVGGPTHAHGMSWTATRRGDTVVGGPADEPPPGCDAAGPALRHWFRLVGTVEGIPAAAFDTRADAPELLTGRASLGISRRLRHHGFAEVAAPRSFLVDRHEALVPGEADRANHWARSVVESLRADVTA